MKQLLQVVMLPTNEVSKIAVSKLFSERLCFVNQIKNKKAINQDEDLVDASPKFQLPISNVSFKHLYLTSNEEIKEGEYGINFTSGSIFKLIKKHEANGDICAYWDVEFITGGNISNTLLFFPGTAANPVKIIATTDKSFQIKDAHWCLTCHDYASKCKCLLPQIPESFIKAYCEAQGNIKEVLVEYERYNGCMACGRAEIFNTCSTISRCQIKVFSTLKLRPDNTVIISPARTYTHQEHISEIKRMIELYSTTYIQGDIDKWIENNL